MCYFLSYFAAEDEEDTIAAQEKREGNVDHAEELDDLNREGIELVNYVFPDAFSGNNVVKSCFRFVLFSRFNLLPIILILPSQEK